MFNLPHTPFLFLLENYLLRYREMGQAADCTPSKIIEFWEVLSFVVVRKCRTFAEAFAWGQGNVDNGNISHQKDWKEKKYRLLTPQNRLKSIKSLNLHPLECTLKGLWHISDLLRTKYWVITGCKYYNCTSLKSVYCKPTTPPAGSSSMFSNNASGRKIYVPMGTGATYREAEYWRSYAPDIILEK